MSNIVVNIFNQNTSNPACNDQNFEDYVRYTQAFNGMQGNSASPCDIWFVNINGEDLVFKLSLNSKTIPINFNIEKEPTKIDYNNDEAGIQYEIDMYKKFINNIVDNNINPFFVKTKEIFEGLSFNEILDSKLHEKLCFPFEKFKWRFIRNTLHMSLKYMDNYQVYDQTPMINGRNNLWSGNSQKAKILNNYINTTLNYTDNLYYNIEVFEKYSHTLRDYYEKDKLVNRNGYLNRTGWTVIIQVLTAISTLEILEIAYNDLHPGNLFIKPLKTNTRKYFQTEIGDFILNSDIECKMYDWDLSYSRNLRPNTSIEQFHCDDSICNEYIPQREVFKFFINFILDIAPNQKDKFMEFLIPDKDNRDNFYNNCDVTFHLQCENIYYHDDADGTPLSRADYIKYGFQTPSNVLKCVLNCVHNDPSLVGLVTIPDDFITTDNTIEKYDMTCLNITNKIQY